VVVSRTIGVQHQSITGQKAFAANGIPAVIGTCQGEISGRDPVGTGRIIGWSEVGAKLPLTRVFDSGPCTCMRAALPGGARAKARIGPAPALSPSSYRRSSSRRSFAFDAQLTISPHVVHPSHLWPVCPQHFILHKKTSILRTLRLCYLHVQSLPTSLSALLMCNPLAAFQRSKPVASSQPQEKPVKVASPPSESLRTMSLGALAGKVALITGASKGTHACFQ